MKYIIALFFVTIFNFAVLADNSQELSDSYTSDVSKMFADGRLTKTFIKWKDKIVSIRKIESGLKKSVYMITDDSCAVKTKLTYTYSKGKKSIHIKTVELLGCAHL